MKNGENLSRLHSLIHLLVRLHQVIKPGFETKNMII